MPAKPHKWGIKKGSNDLIHNNEEDLGATGNLVQRLCRIVPINQNYVVYFDNFYTSLPLVACLAKKGIFSLGTVRRPRIPNCKLPTGKQFNKWTEALHVNMFAPMMASMFSCIAWKDNKTEHIKTTLERFDRKHKKRIEIECPHIISEYNRHMGGVDLMDSLIGRYNIKIRSKKWYIRLFYHLLDQMRVAEKRGETIYINLADFRAEIAYCLCKIGTENYAKRGRPSDTEKNIQKKKQRSATTSYIPPRDDLKLLNFSNPACMLLARSVSKRFQLNRKGQLRKYFTKNL
ncbi:hypothetical protein NQ317_009750 [Molorchus minor]|uniref:PiggyBac transposable element-derived protein domain-containing protein n=1 Tax=Molorchus minor TaxID=1323400 RepID=A0ABQ9J3C7_9CUCU|nr:hypothetical protein NQ317_009750 [Molorchus minor]